MRFFDGIRTGRDANAGDPSRPRKKAVPELGGLLPELARATGCDDWRSVRNPLVRRNCAIYFVRSEGFRHPELVLKIYLPGVVKPNLAKDLYEKSRACHEAATAGCTVPEPILLCPERNAWAMERILVPTSGKRLKTGFPSRATRDRIIATSAAWLKWFHARAPVESARFDADYFLGKLMTLQKKVRLTSPALFAGDPFLRGSIELAKAVAQGLHGTPIPHASAHGDFTPFNLFIRGETTIGFDYLANRRLPVSFDICRFLLYLDLYRLIPARASELRQYGCRQRDFEIFMDAYGGDRGWTEDGRWVQFQFLEVVRRITSLALRKAEGRKFPFGVIETACMRRTARLLMGVLG